MGHPIYLVDPRFCNPNSFHTSEHEAAKGSHHEPFDVARENLEQVAICPPERYASFANDIETQLRDMKSEILQRSMDFRERVNRNAAC